MKHLTFLSTLLLFVFIQFAPGQIPKTMSYQGVLTDPSGAPVPDGNYPLTFKLYEVAGGGSAIWSEDQAVAVSEGIFNVILGKGNPLNLPFNSQYWLGVTVAPYPEMSPRTALTAAPYSLSTSAGGGWTDDGVVVRLTTPMDNVGIGTASPVEKLDVVGTVRMAGFQMPSGASNGYVLTSNASGVGTWQPLSAANAWNLSGNSGTIPGANFLGTSDNQALEVKVNSQRAFRFEPTLTTPNIIGGVSGNTVTPGVIGATISGGGLSYSINQVTGNLGTVVGGAGNRAAAEAFVGGGSGNAANYSHSTIGGGGDNHATGISAFIGGGSENYAGDLAAVAGGSQNNANDLAFVGGGSENSANGQMSVVAGGEQNGANGPKSAIGGGSNNFAPGANSTIPGGSNNTADGEYSFAAGRQAKAIHSGSFVWGDATNADFGSTAANQFLIRASGGVGIRTNAPVADLHVNGHYRYGGYFTSDSASGWTNVIRAEFTGSGLFDPVGVYGKSLPAPYYGYGGIFEGGWKGIEVHAWENGNGSRYGVLSWGSGGSTENYGVLAHASGGSTTYGVYGAGNGGSSNNYGVYASGDLAYTGSLIHVSDEKFKENLHPLSGALAIIKRLNARTFTFTGNPQYAHLNFARGRHYGLTAQEVEQVLPELVSSNTHPSASASRGEKSSDPPVEYKGVNYTELIPILIEAIKEQQQEIEALKAEIKALKDGK